MQLAAPTAGSRAAAPPVAADDVTRQYLRLGVRTEMYATPIAAVREILEVGQMTTLPQTPAFVRGVMNLRGAVVPVIDIGARFGAPSIEIGRRTCVVVVEVGTQTPGRAEGGDRHVVGMMVDAVYEVFETPDSELEAVPPMGTLVAPEFLRSMARVRGQVCPVLQLEQLLAQDTLAELIAQAATEPGTTRKPS